jgi:hypothetical protein
VALPAEASFFHFQLQEETCSAQHSAEKISVSEGSLDAKEITKANATTTTFIFSKQDMTLFG